MGVTGRRGGYWWMGRLRGEPPCGLLEALRPSERGPGARVRQVQQERLGALRRPAAAPAPHDRALLGEWPFARLTRIAGCVPDAFVRADGALVQGERYRRQAMGEPRRVTVARALG